MAARSGTGDPRLDIPEPADGDVRPVVALARRGLPTWALMAIAGLAGLLLFAVLDARRRAAGDEPDPVRMESFAPPAPPPLLVIPSAPRPIPVAPPPQAVPAPAPPQPDPEPLVMQAPYVPPPPQTVPPEVQPQSRLSAEPALIMDTSAPRRAGAATTGEEPGGATAAPSSAGSSIAGSRSRAGTLANRSTTVPQGTLIPAVLESALDSTRPGLARAIVSRDVRGFDGSRILIPRGSRLIGEYASEVQPGQRRALVNWIRLIRPDGVTIAIGSPSADPLGRTGVRARVNSHFFERFAGAILQSALNLGVNLAATQAGTGAVVVLPGALQNGASQAIQPQQITPTLTVRQGTSVSIFVARDLDFTGVDGRR